MGTVWIVTRGIFIGVFSTYEKAADYVKKFGGVNGCDYDITEETID